jgi:hypothetical protein
MKANGVLKRGVLLAKKSLFASQLSNQPYLSEFASIVQNTEGWKFRDIDTLNF